MLKELKKNDTMDKALLLKNSKLETPKYIALKELKMTWLTRHYS